MSIVIFNKTGFDIDISIAKDYWWHSSDYYRVVNGKSEMWSRASGLYKITITGLGQSTIESGQETERMTKSPNEKSKTTRSTGIMHVIVIEATGNDTSLTIGGINDIVLSHGNLYYDHHIST